MSLKALRAEFEKLFPDLCHIAQICDDCHTFVNEFSTWLRLCHKSSLTHETVKTWDFLLHSEGKCVEELSTRTEMYLSTISILYEFLKKGKYSDISPDAIMDIYCLLAGNRVSKEVNKQGMMSRWPSATDKSVYDILMQNKHRIISLLVDKIDKHSGSSRYFFPDGMSHEEKESQVALWWNDYRFHLAMAIRTPSELNMFLGNTLSEEQMSILSEARKKQMPFFVTPYYLSLLNVTGHGYDDSALRSYILYSRELVDAFGSIKAWEKEDCVVAGKPNVAGWLLPEGGNIHRRYPEVAILIPDSMGRACGGLCASCQRMYDFQSKRFNFDLDNLKPKESWSHKLHRLMEYFENDTQLQDILITGGDAFMSQNNTIRNILEAVYQMAKRKRKANLSRPEGCKYAELQRVRLGTRMLAYLPMRINDELVDILGDFKNKSLEVGIKQFIIQTHFQTPLEMTREAKVAIKKLLGSGWLVTNQLVFNVAASRTGHTARLRQVLNREGIMCYYTFSVKGFNENRAVFAPISRSLQEKVEEKRLGIMNEEQEKKLMDILMTSKDKGRDVGAFMKNNDLPFLATDRSVLNLPGIGKSMTFKLAGITPEGCRVLCFSHDKTRWHSPVINAMKDIYIVENKSIAAYLRQLADMGEQLEDYSSIWYYCFGETEPRFVLYQYPDTGLSVTNEITNLVYE